MPAQVPPDQRSAGGRCSVWPVDSPALSFRDLQLRFGPKHLYDGVSLSVQPGETLALIGRSGVGKSVLLKCALGLVHPDEGDVICLGEPVARRPDEDLSGLRQRVGMMFQNYALLDSLTVRENIAWPLRLQGWEDEDRIGERVARSLDEVNLPGIEARLPAELSGGMKKRVSLARALVHEPELVFYDGPTTGLDPANAKRVDSILQELKASRGVTAVLVTHDLRTIDHVADRVAMLHDRHILWVGPVDAMRTDSPQVVRDFVNGNFRSEYAGKA